MEYIRRIAFLIALGMGLCSSALWGQSDRSLVREGNHLFDQSKYPDAEVSYRKALDKNKEIEQAPFNLGGALYKQNRFDEAAEQYRIASTKTTDPGVKAGAMHNLGNALLKSQKLTESIAAYEDALKLNPRDAETKYNLEYAKALLKKQQEQQKPKQDQKKDQKKDKQKQDQQKQDQKKQDQQKQDQQKQDQQKQDQQKQDQKDQQQKKQQISKADAERILEALRNEEKDVKKKLQKKVPARIRVEKDW